MSLATIDDCDREIGRLMALVSHAKRIRKSLVQRDRMKKNRENPVFMARWRDGIALSVADPGRRAQRSFNASQAQKHGPRGLPPMTRRQALDYRKLRRNTNFTREEALAEILRNSGAQPSPLAHPARRDALSASTPAAIQSRPSGRDLQEAD